jgi:hypothetical protein
MTYNAPVLRRPHQSVRHRSDRATGSFFGPAQSKRQRPGPAELLARHNHRRSVSRQYPCSRVPTGVAGGASIGAGKRFDARRSQRPNLVEPRISFAHHQPADLLALQHHSGCRHLRWSCQPRLGGVLSDIKPIIAQAEKTLPRGVSIVIRGQALTMSTSFFGFGDRPGDVGGTDLHAARC